MVDIKDSWEGLGEFNLFHNGIQNAIPNKSIKIEEFLEILKEDNPLLKEIREESDKDKKNKIKGKLSYVTFAGTFSRRKKDSLLKSSGFASFDLDGCEDLEKDRQKIIADKYVHLCFISPSGKGLKFIVKIPEVKSDEEYKKYWNSIARYFNFPENDESVKDISRACYNSYDKDYYFNPDSEVYEDKEENNFQTRINLPGEKKEEWVEKFIQEILPKWKEGDRQALALSTSGYLRKEKRLGATSVKEIISEICDRTQDKEKDMRLQAVTETFKKDEIKVKGIKGLEEKGIVNEEGYIPNKINWTENEELQTWEDIKKHLKHKWGDQTTYYGETPIWYFLAHSKNQIEGKPQLIENVQKKIPLITQIIKKSREKGEEERLLKSFSFIDEKFDQRYDGSAKKSLSHNFWLYRVISQEGKEYYVFAKEKLPNTTCKFKGMAVEVDDFAEVSRSMKIKSLSRIFFLKEFIPDVKIISKEELIEYTKSNKISEEDWLDYLSCHPFETQNRFPKESELLTSAQLLSGKCDGYPLHIMRFGPPGTRKSMGYIETIANKFSDDPQIIEGANSRIKGLSPSFKEKPANIGYLARSERIGFIDELGKMVEFEINKHQSQINNVLGELNVLLDNKKRLVGSGNDNTCEIQANAKFIFVSNPISNHKTLPSHVGLIDPTTMSRILWWVQDENEQDFVLSEKGIVKIPPKHIQDLQKDNLKGESSPNTKTRLRVKENEDVGEGEVKREGSLENVLGGFKGLDSYKDYINFSDFLTIFDSTNSFLSILDDKKIEELTRKITSLAKEPMKGVWKTRGKHHVTLIIDGLCKHRCLFKDYSSDFVANEEDYTLAEGILMRMLLAWDTDLSVKQQYDWKDEFHVDPERPGEKI